jgi:predicted proteasome-type protease
MTFCLGIKVAQGLVAVADTRVIKGHERLSKRGNFRRCGNVSQAAYPLG